MDTLKKEIINALGDCYGIVKDACRKCNVPRSTYYHWLKEDEEFKKEVDDTQEEAIDFVEGQLFQKIKGVQIKKGETDDGEDIIYDLPPSDTAIIFYLKTKGKKRGYVEKQEIEHSGQLGITWHEERTYEKPDVPDRVSIESDLKQTFNSIEDKPESL